MNPSDWRDVNSQGLELLLERDLERYCDKFPDEEIIQEEWRAATTHKGKYVNLLVRHAVTKNYFLAYHQVEAHAHWLESRPDEVKHYNRFQVRTSHLILYV